MRLLLDQGLPRSTIQHLTAVGIVAQRVGDLRMANAEDAAILEMARQQQAVVVSLDADFHRLLVRSYPSPNSECGFVRCRLAANMFLARNRQ